MAVSDHVAKSPRLRRKQVGLVLKFALAVCLTKASAARQVSIPATPKNVDALIETYYLAPNPESVTSLIEALGPSGLLDSPSAVPPTVGFFSEVFARNPKMLDKWASMAKKQDPHTRAALERALSLSKKGGVLSLPGRSPELNDMYWGAFFASGDPKFVKKLIDQLKYCDRRDNLNVFLTGASAKWSLASNALSHPLVKSILLTQERRTDRRTREAIREVLTENPDNVRQWTVQVLKAQKAAGKW